MLAHAEGRGKVDKKRPTQFGRAMRELGIEMIPSYSPQARGRCERCFGTLHGRLPQELARAGITEMSEANAFLREYWPRHNAAFGVEAEQPKDAFVPLLEEDLDEILCLKEQRTAGNNNCVTHRGRSLQIPPRPHRNHCAQAKVEVREYEDGRLAVFQGALRWAATTGTGGSRRRPPGAGKRCEERACPALSSLRSDRSGQGAKTGHFICS